MRHFFCSLGIAFHSSNKFFFVFVFGSVVLLSCIGLFLQNFFEEPLFRLIGGFFVDAIFCGPCSTILVGCGSVSSSGSKNWKVGMSKNLSGSKVIGFKMVVGDCGGVTIP